MLAANLVVVELELLIGMLFLEPMQHLSSADREQMARLMEELLDRVVIEPAERLRSRREFRRKLATVEALRELFGLDREKP